MNRFPATIVFAVLFAIVATAVPSLAQSNASPPAAALSQADLEEMLAPIALYPDALLANFLAAAVYPDDLRKADAFLKGGGNADQLGAQGFEPPVVAIAKIPDALDMLVDNMEWGEAIGQAYIVQSQDVMAAVQALRAKARANGALKTGPQQTVVESGDVIIIESPSPEVIYVPTYQPAVVYAAPGYSSSDMFWNSAISFGVGVAAGAIIANNMDCDWHGGCIGWGNNDVDIDIDRDVNIGEVNINRNEANVNKVKNNVNSGNRPGAEGTAWKPNSNKVDTNKVKANAQSGSLSKYKGASSGTASSPKMPGRNAGDPPAASRNRAAPTDRSAANANRGATPRPQTPQKAPSANRSSNTAQRSRPETPKAKPAPRDSGFKMDSRSSANSSRGSASRSGSGSRSAPSRSGGGGRGGGRGR